MVDDDEEQEGEFDGQARLEQSQGGDWSDDFGTRYSIDGTFWLDGDSGIGDSSTDPTSVSTPITDTCF
jgi:hypothetical protein